MSMMKQRQPKLAHGVVLMVVVQLALMLGCSKEAKKTSSTGTEVSETTATATVNADSQQLEFFTERYLAPEQRLKRRQDRVEAVLSAP